MFTKSTHCNRSHHGLWIPVSDEASKVIKAPEHMGDFKEP